MGRRRGGVLHVCQGIGHARRLPGNVVGYARPLSGDCRADRGSALVQEMATATRPDRLYFTGNDEADILLARDPMALLIGFALDQQVPVQTAFTGPLKLKQRLGTLEPARIAKTDPAKLEAAFREKPAIHRFPGAMAQRVQDLAAHVAEEYGGKAERLWADASDGPELRRRIEALPGFGNMKVKALSAVLAKRFGVATAQEIAPNHPTLGDVDSPDALAEYQAKKRARKSALRQAEPPRETSPQTPTLSLQTPDATSLLPALVLDLCFPVPPQGSECGSHGLEL